MARSHHRKKHKEHLRQFRHSHETASRVPKKGKASQTFAVAGVVLGLALGYFASVGSFLWMGIGLVAGGLAGYLIGRRIDAAGN
jgi:shikimate kinase